MTTFSSTLKTPESPLDFIKIGPYRLVRELGRGVSGIRYEAEHLTQGRKVALKLLDRNTLDRGPISRQDALFAREAMILAKLPPHPGVIGVLDAGLSDGLPYLVTEYVDGRTFSDLLRLRRSELREMVRILRDVALAVHHAHENGILHRNLKPSNVLVDVSSRPYVTDFGAAKRMGPDQGQSTSTFLGGIVGTSSYVSPEQAAGLKSIDRRTDVYSLGSMLYEILTGVPPFVGGSSVADVVNIIQSVIVPPSQAAPEWAAWKGDKSIEQVCMSALVKKPDGRTPTALAFADALTGWLEQTPARKVTGIKSWLWGLTLAGLGSVAALLGFVRGQ